MSRFSTTVRSRLWYSLSPETAAAAGLSLSELQQAAIGRIGLSEQQMQPPMKLPTPDPWVPPANCVPPVAGAHLGAARQLFQH
jgi:hypothetical protein